MQQTIGMKGDPVGVVEYYTAFGNEERWVMLLGTQEHHWGSMGILRILGCQQMRDALAGACLRSIKAYAKEGSPDKAMLGM